MVKMADMQKLPNRKGCTELSEFLPVLGLLYLPIEIHQQFARLQTVLVHTHTHIHTSPAKSHALGVILTH